ncbi:MAG: MFS transporter [Anaerolineae bacterium]|nr:MFS transporter [Anaerolineae bacterium]
MSTAGNRRADRKWTLPFFSIWSGQQLSLVGSTVAQFALVWWLTKTTGSATVLATATLVALLPDIFLGPIAGAYVDRWNRRVVMILADGLVALAALWLAYLFWTGSLAVWHVYVVMLIRSLGGMFHWPAMSASTALMVPEEHLSRVAGLNQTVKGALNIVGAPLGALLMEVLPLHGVMLVDVGTALLAIIPLLFVLIPQPERRVEARQASIWSDVRDGFRYLMGWKGLVVLIGAAMIFKIVLTPAFSLIPLLVSDHFGGDAVQLGMTDSAAGLGLLLGGLLLGVWGGFRRKIYTTLGGMIIFGISFVALGMTPGSMFGGALVSIFVAGFTISLIDGPIMAIMQAGIAPELQGRVFTLLGSLLSMTSPIGLIVAGPISDAMGITIWYIVAGVLCGLIGVVGFFIPALVNIEQNNNGSVKKDTVAAGTTPEFEATI